MRKSLMFLTIFSITIFTFFSCKKNPTESTEQTEPTGLEISEKVSANIYYPYSGSIVSGLVLIDLSAMSKTGYRDELSKVELYIDHKLVYFDTPSSNYLFYDYEWDTSSLNDNSLYSIKFYVFDKSGNVDTDEKLDVKVIHNYFSENDIEGVWQGKAKCYIDLLTSKIDSIDVNITVESSGNATGSGMKGIWTLDPERDGKVTGEGSFSFIVGSNLISCNAEWDLKLDTDKTFLYGSMRTTAYDPYDSWYLSLIKQ